MSTFSENYTVLKEFRTEFDPDVFDEKIVQVLLKYDFLVGDLSDNQLRLKGFYHDRRRDVEPDKHASRIDKYIKQYCNYMCPHYILEKIQERPHNGRRSYDQEAKDAYGQFENFSKKRQKQYRQKNSVKPESRR